MPAQTPSPAPAPVQTALILGGAQGPAYALSRALGESGVQLLLTDREGEAAQIAARSLGHRGAACDPANGRDMAKLAYDASDALGDLDLIVLALGDSLTPGGSTAMAEGDFLSHLHGQSLPFLHLARHFLPALRARKRGAVLVLAQLPSRGDPWQDAAGAWVAAATRALAREWASDNVVINTITTLRPDAAPLPKFMQAGPATATAVPPPAPEVTQAALALCRAQAGATGQVLSFDLGRKA